MKKNGFTLFIFLLLGLLTGAILTGLLDSIEWLRFLTKSSAISWAPQADFNVVRYSFMLEIKLNLISIICVGLAIWIYRKL